MALVTPAWSVFSQADAVPRPVTAQPLQDAYEACARLYEEHTPAAVVMPCIEASGAGTREIVFGCEPSADDLDYTLRIVGTKASGALSVTFTVSEYVSSSWSAIVSSSAVALGSGTDFDVTIDLQPVDGDATAIKIDTAAAGANYQIQCVALYPDAANISAPDGTTAARYVGMTDGLIGTSNAPLTPEHLNRIAESASAVYRDRKQAVFGFGQPVSRSARAVADVATYGQGKTVQFGVARYYVPHAPNNQASITVRAYGEHDGSSGTVDVQIRFSAPGLEPVVVRLALPAGSPDFVEADAEIPVGANGFGTAQMEVVTLGTAAKTTYPYSVVGWWTP